jgi:transposase
MSISAEKLLFDGFGLKGIQVTNSETIEGVLYIDIETDPKKLKCSHCQSRDVIKRGAETREIKEAPMGLRQVILRAKVQRLGCKNCGKVLQEKLPYAAEKKSIPMLWSRHV